jgi:Zinc finger, C3HC4 type (RING finger)
MNICIRVPGTTEWSSSVLHVTPAIRDAYAEYKERPRYYQETPYLTTEYIVYRPDNDPYFPTYIARVVDIPALVENGVATGIGAGLGVGLRNNLANNINITREIHDTMESSGKSIPILDLNDISVFIVDNPGMSRANWLSARSYQAWAYRDFVYDAHRSIKKSYMSRNTRPIDYESNDRILTNQIVTIQVANIASNIVFNLSRNENNSVYFERNDTTGSRVRICDNEYARSGYLGFYTRITMDPGIVVIPPPPQWGGVAAVYYNTGPSHLSTAHLPDPEETDDEEHQCILCFKYRVNARFSPCEHQVCCSTCYSKMSKNECPVCRADITRVMIA